jgi:hypothetical protein
MYKYLDINDIILYDIHHKNNNILVITNNKLENKCNIYIYQIKRINNLYYLSFNIFNYIKTENNIGIHKFINNIEKNSEKNKDDLHSYTIIDTFNSLHNVIEFLNSQFKKIHTKHYLVQNSNIYKNGSIYYIHYMSNLLK